MAQTEDEDIRKGALQNHMFDTRSLSMAGATIADIYGRSSIGINAALAGLFNKPTFFQLNTNYNWNSNLMMHDLTLPTLYYGPHRFTARFGLFHYGSESIPFTTPSSMPEPDIIMYRGELAYAIAISEYFSLGVLHSISLTSNEHANVWSYFADVGLVYAPDGPVSYGLVFRGLGHRSTYDIFETGETTLVGRLARQILEAGVTLRYPIEERTYLSISFANEKRFGEDGLWYKGGFEVTPYSFIDIRAGAVLNFDQSLFIPRIGLGINMGVFQIDYMISPQEVIGEQFHQFGLTFQI